MSKQLKLFKEDITNRLKTELKSELRKFYDLNDSQSSKKSDGTIVTSIDLFVSSLVKETLIRNCGQTYSFYSEEDQESSSLPCVILDPIDGTNSLAKKGKEYVVSLAVIHQKGESHKDWGLLYNPITGFLIESQADFIP